MVVATRYFGPSVPLYCPHKGCGWDFDGSRPTGEKYLKEHLRLLHAGVDSRPALEESARRLRRVGTVPAVSTPRKGAAMRWPEDAILGAINDHAALHQGLPPATSDWKRATPSSPAAATVKERFGSWANAIERAGFPRPIRGLSPAQVAKHALGETVLKTNGEGGAAEVVVVFRNDGLTQEEGAVMDHLIAAVTEFAALPRQHPNELPDFVTGIHACQNELAKRLCRRTHPQGWPTYNE